MDLSIIIVNWNSVGFITQCVSSIYSETSNLQYEIVVVDNASYDGSAELLGRLFPQVRFIQAAENLGFGRANNLGFHHSTGRNILFLNPDTEVKGAALNRMVSFLDTTPDAGLVAPKLLCSDLSLDINSVQKSPTIVNLAFDATYLRLKFPRWGLWGMAPLSDHSPRPYEVEVVPGACLMIKREVFERVGGFDPRYFMYVEDVDLCFEVRAAGFKNYYVGDACVIHHGGGSSKKRGGQGFSVPMMRESYVIFFEKTRGYPYASLYRLSTLLISIFRIAIVWALLLIPSARLDKGSLRHSLAKWYKILCWSIGLEAWTRQRGKPVASHTAEEISASSRK
jgi:GT2 family glycosyltransferase